MVQSRMTCREADTLLYYLNQEKSVVQAKVYERTCDAVITYTGSRAELLMCLQTFHYADVNPPAGILDNSGRELNQVYQEKMVARILWHYTKKLLLPYPLRVCLTTFHSLKYLWNGVKTLARGRIEVPVLDATAIGVSVFRGDFATAGSIMFMLGIGELLEEWTHKKSVDDLARSLSLHIPKVWVLSDGKELLVDSTTVRTGDHIVVHMGTVIPFDGEVTAGEAMVNQASLTGESVPVRKSPGSSAYAGTVVEEGELTILVKNMGGSSRYEKIITMIEDSEKLKSDAEGKAGHLADRLVPFSLGATAATYLITRNVTKALSILMVDYSCALKLSMPIAVLSAIREASQYHITVKGGKFLEAVAEADTIVFDKTGTLTKARPTVVDVISFREESPLEMLRIAACLEEHFPHSMAKAVVDAAKEKQLEHEEMHSKVEYIVAHGIVSTINGKHAAIGSAHFIFEDEGCVIPAGKQAVFDALPKQYSHLYLGLEGKLAAVILIEDPLRPEAGKLIRGCKKLGIGKTVMMTGDSERTAAAIAKCVGVDEYYSEVLPEDKAAFVEKEKAAGRRVIMIGDGINDSPALSAADVGIAISDGAEIAREIADISIAADNLESILTLRKLSEALMKRIHRNYSRIVSFNSLLILLGVLGVIPPTTSALLHNSSTLLIGLESMKNLLEEGTES